MRSMRLAALTVAMTLAFSGLALARDHDDRYKEIITGTITTSNDHYKDRHEDRHHDWDRDRDHHWWGGITTGITIAGGKANANEPENMSAGNANIATTATTAARFTTAIPAATLAAAIMATRAADMAIPAQSTGAADTATVPAASASTKDGWRVRTRRARTSRKASPSTRIRGAPTTPTTDITATWATRTSIGRLTPRATVQVMNQTSAGPWPRLGILETRTFGNVSASIHSSSSKRHALIESGASNMLTTTVIQNDEPTLKDARVGRSHLHRKSFPL